MRRLSSSGAETDFTGHTAEAHLVPGLRRDDGLGAGPAPLNNRTVLASREMGPGHKPDKPHKAQIDTAIWI